METSPFVFRLHFQLDSLARGSELCDLPIPDNHDVSLTLTKVKVSGVSDGG